MGTYSAPEKELLFVLREVADIGALMTLPDFAALSDDLVDAIVEEAGRFSAEVIAPTNAPADREGTKLAGRTVTTPPALDGVYKAYCAGGWPSLTGPLDYGGQGLPHTLGFAVDEILQSANLAFSLLPMLTQGVITALVRYGSDHQKALYLPRLVSGEWTGTMNLTEPEAGSDLARVTTRAEPEGDHYRLFGQKIFITWGDHGFTDNIIHLVLARTPGAPEGVKGISLFIVPKFLVNDDGSLAGRNPVYPVGVEHKLGIHASPTCTLQYGDGEGALGYLVGRENEGLRYMFAMMNHARLAVGLQGVSLSERACQQAYAYACERRQGSLPGRGVVAIIEHPDVRRMYLTMEALTQAGRSLTLVAMHHFDMAGHAGDENLRSQHQQRVDLLTPVVKGWCTELVNEVTSLAIQIHGGAGYIEETGVAQYYRDARITSIYEGTNGIQAMDLVGRKILANQGQYYRDLESELRSTVDAVRGAGLAPIASGLDLALTDCRAVVEALLARTPDEPDYAGAVAHAVMMLLGITVAGCYLAKGAVRATAQGEAAPDDLFYRRKIDIARVFAEQILPRTSAYRSAALAGGEAFRVNWL